MTQSASPWRIRRLDVTGSTNDDARKAALAGEAEGLVICAARQTAGKGRHGRAWESPAGNLHVSILLRPKGDAQGYGAYGFAAALAMRDLTKQILPHAEITLKWPNDVLANGRKIGGILLETEEDALIVGIGLNVRHYPADALYPAASFLSLGGALPELPEILDELLARLAARLGVLRREGFAPIREAWLTHAHKGGLSVRLADRVLEGSFAGLGEDGRLRLRLADGSEQAIATGDVFLLSTG